MRWIEDFSRGSFGLFAGQVIDGFQPIDFYHFFPLWYDLLVTKTAETIRTLGFEQKSFAEIRHLLPPPSNIEAILMKLIPTYQGWQDRNREDAKVVTNFLARMLLESRPNDPFARISNPFHTPQEVAALTATTAWRDADVVRARDIGRLITATGSLVHGLYNDVVTDLGWDAYGPYTLEVQGKTRSFLIRDFPNLQPKELWPQEYLPSIKELMIYTTYEDVVWEISAVGCHTISKSGSPVTGMRSYAVIADGVLLSPEEIQALIAELSLKAEELYRHIPSIQIDQLKQQALLQECFQLKLLHDAAGVDWRPTKEMVERIQGKALLVGMIPKGTMMTTLNEYKEVFGIRLFAKEVLGEDI